MPRDLLNFFARYGYDPYGRGQNGSFAFQVRQQVKSDGFLTDGEGNSVSAIDFMVSKLAAASPPAEFFGSDVIAVPVPKSTPIKPKEVQTTLWVPYRICQALHREKLVGSVELVLERTESVKASHQSKSKERAKIAQHIASLRAAKSAKLFEGSRLLLVDDFLTLGRTMIACHTVLLDSGFTNEINGFALMLTRGQGNFEKLLDPVSGTISRRGEWVERQP